MDAKYHPDSHTDTSFDKLIRYKNPIESVDDCLWEIDSNRVYT